MELILGIQQNQFPLLMLVVMFALMYFLLIKPQKKQMKIRNEMLANLKNGDKIITSGGITGYIRAITDEYIYVEIAEGLTIEMIKQAVSQVIHESEIEEYEKDIDENDSDVQAKDDINN